MTYTSYFLVNKYVLILPNQNKDVIANLGSYTGHEIGQIMEVNEKRPFMCFKTTAITNNIENFKKNLKNIIKKKILSEYDIKFGTVDDNNKWLERPAIIVDPIILLIKHANGWYDGFKPQTKFFTISNEEITSEEFNNDIDKTCIFKHNKKFFRKKVTFNDPVREVWQYKTSVIDAKNDENNDDQLEIESDAENDDGNKNLLAIEMGWSDAKNDEDSIFEGLDHKPTCNSWLMPLSFVKGFVSPTASEVSEEPEIYASALLKKVKEHFLNSTYVEEAFWLGNKKDPLEAIDFLERDKVTGDNLSIFLIV